MDNEVKPHGKWARGIPPIAMRLANGAEWSAGSWRGTLTEPAKGKGWWFCLHNHETEAEAQQCARQMWFTHHG